MSILGEARLLGGIGSILMLLILVPGAGPVLAIAGLILVAMAISRISRIVNNPLIFRDFLIGIAIAFAIGIATAIMSVFLIRHIIRVVEGAIIPFIALYIFIVISAIYLKRSYDAIAKALNIGMFSTAGLLYLVGAATQIVIVGFIIRFVAIILQTVAFFEIPEELPKPQPTKL